MATDYSILESELNGIKTQLKRDLHMKQVRRLTKKRDDLAAFVIQKRQIKLLEKQLVELKPTVSALYSPLYALKDSEIRGYLVYLLQMKDQFTREVATKMEMISQIDFQIKEVLRELCQVTNERAKKNRSIPAKSQEFVRLENISDRMEQMNRRICTMQQENKEIMENILKMAKFQRQFKAFEKDFRRKIRHLRTKAQEHLTKAVNAYEEKDDFTNKNKMFQERRAQDLRKAAINENALSLCIQKSEKNDTFAKLQNTKRADNRIAEVSDMLEKGVTGLEPILEENQDLHSSIADAAGDDNPDKMEEQFKLADNDTESMFSYLDEVLKDINCFQNVIDELKKENKNLLKTISVEDRKMRNDTEVNQELAKKKLQEAEKMAKVKDKSQAEVESLLDSVRSLYKQCCPDDAGSLQETPLDDSNVMDYLEDMEKQLLEYLICLELIRMKEESEEEKPLVLEEGDEDEDKDFSSVKEITLQPRILRSDSDLHSLADLVEQDKFLEFEELSDITKTALDEMESAKSGGETVSQE